MELASFTAKINTVEPLSPKDSFFGGRTAPTRLHCKVQEDEIIRYMDYVSLYPTVNKYDKMPHGHPTIIPKPDGYAKGQYFGLVKCRVLPPRALYHPVLPYRSGGKLMFPLCRTCAATKASSTCHHSSIERAISGTWVSVELDRALSNGYTIMDVYEIWHYSNTLQLDPKRNTKGLFSEYVNTLLKIKQESSGWPERLHDETAKEEFIKEYAAREGITLDPEAMEANTGKRTLSKLMLNSLWGKFGQRENLPQTKYLHDFAQFIELLTCGKYQVNDLHLINEDMAMVDYVSADEFVAPSGKTSVVIASFTTACARLRLYDLLEILQENVLYMDTDSVIFVGPRDTNPLQHLVGDCLGCVTDEITDAYGPSVYITEFVSGGPKNYGYLLSNGKDCWKVKGITQNYRTCQTMSYETIWSMVMEIDNTPVRITNDLITRNKKTAELVNKKSCKTYRIVFDKAYVDASLKAWPYGY